MITMTGGKAQEDEDYNSSQWEASDEGISSYDHENVYTAEEEADNTQEETEPQSQDEC